MVPTRDAAYQLLTEYTTSESLLKHGLAVEATMRYFAKKRGDDAEKWGIIGLIHDVDFEKFPEEHCQKCQVILREANWPEDYIRAVASHGWKICSNIQPQTELEKSLYAIDELTGLITAAVLVRPSKSILDLQVNSVKKKWKDRSFAAGADRSVIQNGAAMLGIELTELIADTLEGMKTAAKELGLQGNL